jgi:hypothetical protein
MPRGPKQKLQGCHPTTINLEDRHVDYLSKHGLEKSEFYRQYIDFCIKNESSQIEQLKIEIETEEREIQERINALEQKKLKLQELESEELIREATLQKKTELEITRNDIFESEYKVLIRHREICEIDFYKQAKIDFKFENIFETANWLLIKYSEININGKSYSESKIKTFLRYDDKNLARLW